MLWYWPLTSNEKSEVLGVVKAVFLNNKSFNSDIHFNDLKGSISKSVRNDRHNLLIDESMIDNINNEKAYISSHKSGTTSMRFYTV